MLMETSLPKFDVYQGINPELQIVLRVTQTLDVLIFFNKKFCLMSGLKFTLSEVASFLPYNLSRLKRILFRPEATIT